jgi:hypothetical protein
MRTKLWNQRLGKEGDYDNVGWQKLPKTLHAFKDNGKIRKKARRLRNVSNSEPHKIVLSSHGLEQNSDNNESVSVIVIENMACKENQKDRMKLR